MENKIIQNENQSTNASIHNAVSKNQSSFVIKDNRPRAILQQKQVDALQDAPIQKKANNTGLPNQLKSGIENLSGHSMDDVKVHYNSDKPAQLNAHAYAQGTEIHIASGQEKHLPHEAWHVVQQKQGRVKPTMQMKGKVNVNDDKGLEKEADVMGAKALQRNVIKEKVEYNKPISNKKDAIHSSPIQGQWINDGSNLLQWNSLLNGVQWFEIISGDKKGEMFYQIADDKVINPKLLASYAANQNKPMPREYWAANSALGDIYKELNANVISPEEAEKLPKEHSQTETFLHAYAEEILPIIDQVPAMTEIISQIIAVERAVSATHFVFYHGIQKTARLMMEFNKAKGEYEANYGSILQFLRSPELFSDENRPQTTDEAAKGLSTHEGDHGKIRSHLIALSTSLFSNFNNVGESTLHFFMKNINISSPWVDQLQKKLPAHAKQNRGWWRDFNNLAKSGEHSGDLLQIIIPKDIANKIVLATTAGGTPAGMDIGEALAHGPRTVDTPKGSEHLQGRLLLTSDSAKTEMSRVITHVYSFGEPVGLDEKIKTMVAKLLQ